MTDNAYSDPAARLRLLECWLPLVQELDCVRGWNAGPAAREQIILAAAQALTGTPTVAEARAILQQHYRQSQDIGP